MFSEQRRRFPAIELAAQQVRACLGPQGLAEYDSAELMVAGVGILLIAFADSRAPSDFSLVTLSAVVVAAGWLLGRLVAVGVMAGAVLPVLVLGSAGRVSSSAAFAECFLLVLLAILTRLASAALRRRDTTIERDKRVQELSFLLAAAQALGASLEVDAVLSTALRNCVEAFKADAAALPHVSFHEVGGETARVAVESRPACAGIEYPVATNQGARGAIKSGRVGIVRPDHLLRPFSEVASAQGWQVIALAPVRSGRKLFGLLTVALADRSALQRDELRTLEMLAQMTGLAIGNAQHLQHQQQEIARMQARDKVRGELMELVSQEMKTPLSVLTGYLSQLAAGSLGDLSQPVQKLMPRMAKQVSEMEELVKRLEEQVAVDSRTGLPTATVGLEALERDVARAHRTLLGRHSVGYLTVDGGPEGEKVLKRLAAALRARLRREDLVFRYGERALVCSMTDIDGSSAAAILAQVRKDLGRRGPRAPVRMGVASLRFGQTGRDLLESARHDCERNEAA